MKVGFQGLARARGASGKEEKEKQNIGRRRLRAVGRTTRSMMAPLDLDLSLQNSIPPNCAPREGVAPPLRGHGDSARPQDRHQGKEENRRAHFVSEKRRRGIRNWLETGKKVKDGLVGQRESSHRRYLFLLPFFQPRHDSLSLFFFLSLATREGRRGQDREDGDEASFFLVSF